MTFRQIQHIERDKDFIFPCRKKEIKDLQSIISVNNLDFEGEFSTYQLVYGEKGNKIYVLGLGEEKDVITSYSIHYTKLYEFLDCFFQVFSQSNS